MFEILGGPKRSEGCFGGENGFEIAGNGYSEE